MKHKSANISMIMLCHKNLNNYWITSKDGLAFQKIIDILDLYRIYLIDTNTFQIIILTLTLFAHVPF